MLASAAAAAARNCSVLDDGGWNCLMIFFKKSPGFEKFSNKTGDSDNRKRARTKLDKRNPKN